MTFTHKVGRGKDERGETRWYVPEKDAKVRIKCNLEGATIVRFLFHVYIVLILRKRRR